MGLVQRMHCWHHFLICWQCLFTMTGGSHRWCPEHTNLVYGRINGRQSHMFWASLVRLQTSLQQRRLDPSKWGVPRWALSSFCILLIFYVDIIFNHFWPGFFQISITTDKKSCVLPFSNILFSPQICRYKILLMLEGMAGKVLCLAVSKHLLNFRTHLLLCMWDPICS